MTDIFLNHVSVDFEIEGDSTDLGSCIKAFESELNSCGHVITGIGVDGEEVSEWRDGDFQKRPLSEVNELQILASTREELILLGFESCLECIKEIGSELGTALGRYRDDEYREASDALSKALNFANELVMVYDAISVNMQVVPEPPPGFVALVDNLGALAGLFEGIKEASDSGDVIAITDLIEYEAIPLVALLEEELTSLSK